MKSLSTHASIRGIASLFVLLLACAHAVASPMMPPMDPSMGMMMGPPMPQPMGQCGPPMMMGACPPPMSCGKSFNIEGGARAYYTTNSLFLTSTLGDIDFTRSLTFSPNTVIGELYGSVRMPGTFAFTYTFGIPRRDDGDGVLPGALTVNTTAFAAGTPVHGQLDLTTHRLEAEVYLSTGCNMRVAAFGMAEVLVRTFKVQAAAVSDFVSDSRFILGAGGTAEYAPMNGAFVKVKGAVTFLEDQVGWYADGEGKFFPKMDNGCGGPSGFRPYVGGGFRFRTSFWNINAATQLRSTVYGPYAEAGVVF